MCKGEHFILFPLVCKLLMAANFINSGILWLESAVKNTNLMSIPIQLQ